MYETRLPMLYNLYRGKYLTTGKVCFVNKNPIMSDLVRLGSSLRGTEQPMSSCNSYLYPYTSHYATGMKYVDVPIRSCCKVDR